MPKVASTKANTGATTAIDTRTANFMIAWLRFDGTPGSWLSDSAGNPVDMLAALTETGKWIPLTTRSEPNFGMRGRLFFIKNPLTSEFHTFTNLTGGGTIFVLAVSGVQASPIQSEAGGATGSAPGATSCTTASLTPTQPHTMLVAGLTQFHDSNTTSGMGVSSGWNLDEFFNWPAAGGGTGGGLAHRIVSDTTARNITWSWTNNAYAASGIVALKIDAPAATGVTATGPTSGTVGVASSNFDIGVTPPGGAITGTVVVTPSDGGGGGTFTPTTVSLSSGSPTATLTYTAASAGVKTISFTNNGGLTNPSNISFTASNPGSAPNITDEPDDISVVAGQTATFNVAATGTAPLTYQWRRNGSNISGATAASYTTPATTVSGGLANNGDLYSVVVSGSVAPPDTSVNAVLTVAAAGVLTSATLGLKNNTGSLHLNAPFEAYVNHPSTGALVIKKTGLTSHASTGVVTFNDPALVPGTVYAVRWRHTGTGAEGFERLTAT